MTEPIRFAVNGTATQASCRADLTVLEWLRGDAGLRGTKEGCAEGDCGACTVLVQRPSIGGDSQKPIATNACILLMGQLEGASVTTVEGLAAMGHDGHAVQTEMAKNGSSQCGFCTPGIVASLAGLCDTKDDPEEADIHEALAGNLCRCTGYRPIVEAAFAAAKSSAQLPVIETQTPSPMVGNQNSHIHHPATLSQLLDLRAEHADAVLLAGGTDLSLSVAHAKARWPHIIATRNVAEMRAISEEEEALHFGGGVTWGEALPHVADRWPHFANLIRRFGSIQIRAQGTIAGNLATASPIGDGAPPLLALGASVRLASLRGERDVKLSDFFTGYRTTVMKEDEVISRISIPHHSADDQLFVYKVSKRFDQDISTVCGAFHLGMKDGVVERCRVAFGGMAATPIRVTELEDALVGTPLDDVAVDAGRSILSDALAPIDDMRGTGAYRMMVAGNLLKRVRLELSTQAEQRVTVHG